MKGPIDTSTLGPIRFDPDRDAERARVVREAIRKAAESEEDDHAARAMEVVARWAQPATLALLGRLLKS